LKKLSTKPPGYGGNARCDVCASTLAPSDEKYHCGICKFDLCTKCHQIQTVAKKYNEGEQPLFGHFSDPSKIGKGIHVSVEKTQIIMRDHKQYRSAQLNTPFRKTEEKHRFNFKVAVSGI
jgi:hypothetical protein